MVLNGSLLTFATLSMTGLSDKNGQPPDPYYDDGGLPSADDSLAGEPVKDLRGEGQKTSLMQAAMAQFLEELAPKNYRAGQWGELKRLHLPDNSYRWLCEAHARQARR